MNKIKYRFSRDVRDFSENSFNPLAHGRISRPITHIENGIKRFVYTHSLPLNFFEKNFSFEGARPEKGLKIWPFSKNLKPKSSFLNIFQKFLQKWTPHTLFTLFWYPTLHMWNFNFSSFCPRVSQKSIKKIFLLGFVWKFFWLKQKN